MSKTIKLVSITILGLILLTTSILLIYNKKFFLLVILLILSIYIIFLIDFLINSRKKSNFIKRNRIVALIVTFLTLLIFIRLIQIQFFDRNKYTVLMNNQILSTNKEVGERGIIYDIKGKKLAFNKRLYTLSINPDLLNNEKYASNILKDIDLIRKNKLLKFDKDLEKKLYSLATKHKNYKILAKNIDDDRKKNIEEVIKKAHYRVDKKNNIIIYKSLFNFEKNIERIYYKEKEYEKLIGMVKYSDKSTSKLGISGLEKEYEDYLVERKRVISKLYGLNKKNILPLSKDTAFSDLNGKNLYLTIDSDINYILNDEMKLKFEETKAREAYGIIMDPNTGKILALSSLSRDKNLTRNNIFQSQYEPGSIFKPIIVAAALNEKLIKKSSKFDIGNGTILKYKKIIRESSKSTKGILETKDILIKSSNVGMVLISDYFSDELFEKYLKNFGLYEKTNVDFPNELKPYTISYKKWDKLKKNNMAFGQGIVVTPIQMASAFSAVINGGTLYRPYLVDKITDNDGTVIRRNIPEKIRTVISEEVSSDIRKMLEETVSEGTGKKASIDGYLIGGKTGTAQLSAGKLGYEKEEYLASFVGFFPVDKPKYLVLVMFMRPQADEGYKKFGGYVSAPVVGNIFRQIIKYDKNLSHNISKINYLSLEHKNINNDNLKNKDNIEVKVMPNLIGLSPREVIDIFKNEDIEIKIEGKGMVSTQYPESGVDLETISSIKIILK